MWGGGGKCGWNEVGKSEAKTHVMPWVGNTASEGMVRGFNREAVG